MWYLIGLISFVVFNVLVFTFIYKAGEQSKAEDIIMDNQVKHFFKNFEK